MSAAEPIRILPFAAPLKEDIKRLNYEWLEKYFVVEPADVVALSNPQEEIIDKGGMIFFAQMNGEVVGTVSLLKKSENIYEVGKMAVTESAQGQGIGRLLLEHCLKIAIEISVEKLILYSNRKLVTALRLYEKYGFVEVSMDTDLYARADIKMERSM